LIIGERVGAALGLMGSDQVKSSKVDLLTVKYTYSTFPIHLHEPYLLNVLKSGEVFPDTRNNIKQFFLLDIVPKLVHIKPMKVQIKLSVMFFQTDSGNEPVREWLKYELTSQERFIIGRDIKILETSWPVGPPLVISLGEGLWELRSNLDNKIARVLFVVHNNQIVLLQGFIKKSKKTPKKEMDLARKRNPYLRKDSVMKHKKIGSKFDDFLREDGILAEVEKAAIKEVVAKQISQLMISKKISKVEMSRMMGTSRSALDRLLDPKNQSVSLKTLDKAATSLGKRLIIQIA
jgi:phage-related protein/DNA-binding Xre family transcriptional regulator